MSSRTIVIRPGVLRGVPREQTSREQLTLSSLQHRDDVAQALALFASACIRAAWRHDKDKIAHPAAFHEYFQGRNDAWFKEHCEANRHHLQHPEGTPLDVNLIDVLDYIADCVTSGMSRKGVVYDVTIDADVLRRAFENTVKLLMESVEVAPAKCDGNHGGPPCQDPGCWNQ